MNKKGFTLIELLAVVTIIALISIITIPSITKKVKDKKNEISEANQKLLAAATDTYIENNSGRYEYSYEANGSTYCIPIQTLIDNGVLEKPFKNVNGQEIDYRNQVQATYQAQYNSFDYQIVENCQELKQYVSRPNLSENMIPVTYDETLNIWKKADENSHWYNYSEKKWANAVLVKEFKSTDPNSKSRYEYKEAPAGTPIIESDILAQFVWIPRFKYQLFESNARIPITIVFEKQSDQKSTGTVSGQWLTHPAFTYNNQELSGIWVGKYEASNQDNNIIIKLNQTAWTNVNYVEANEKAISMTNENNIYGLKNVNPHMTRNSEWGAAIYLTYSKYGNQSNNSSTGNITGIYNLSGNKEFVILDNKDENSLGYALNETKNWVTNNSYTTNENIYLTRGNSSIFSYNNSTLIDQNTTFRISLSNFETQTEDYKNNYMVTFDYNMNLLYGLEDKETTTFSKGTYSISNGTVTVNATANDSCPITPGRVYLEAGKTYVFNCDTDGTWGGTSNSETVEAYLLKDGAYTTYYRMASKNYEFTPTVTGTYSLRLDVNQSGKTHTFSNISIKEKATTKQVTHGTQYGELPTPTNKPGYTFMGWNGRNYFNYEDKKSVTAGITTDENGFITINTAEGTQWYNYFTNNLNVNPDTTYSSFLEVKEAANLTGNFYIASGYSAGYSGTHSQFLGQYVTRGYIISNSILKNDIKTDTNFGTGNQGLRTFYSNINKNANELITFRISVLDKNDSITANNFEYEPYYITPSTTVVQPRNHTLKAIWKANS